MGKSSSAFELALGGWDRSRPKSRWLHEAIKEAILGRRLPGGTRLPSSRDVAATLGVARGTVVAVYELLRAEGYIESRTGAGTWVRSVFSPAAARRRPARRGRCPGRFSRRSEALARFRFATPGRDVDTTLFPYYPALDLFPVELWHRIASRRLRSLDRTALGNQAPLGFPPLREAIADYLRLARGLECSAGRIAIVAGVQQALDVLARIVADPGDAALVEDPCYPGAVAALAGCGLRIRPVAVDGEGLRIADARRTAASLAFVTPAHQAPLGVILSARRRIELLDWALRHRSLVLEDDYDGEFRHEGAPLPALGSMDPRHVATFGSFTKTLFPSIRLGFLVLPDWIVARFEAAIAVTARYPQLAVQQVLFDFIVQGHYARHIQRMRATYRLRRDALYRAVAETMPASLTMEPAANGLSAIAWLAKGSAADVQRRAMAGRLAVVPLSRYVLDERRAEGLVLGFGNASAAALRTAIPILEKAVGTSGRRRRSSISEETTMPMTRPPSER